MPTPCRWCLLRCAHSQNTGHHIPPGMLSTPTLPLLLQLLLLQIQVAVAIAVAVRLQMDVSPVYHFNFISLPRCGGRSRKL